MLEVLIPLVQEGLHFFIVFGDIFDADIIASIEPVQGRNQIGIVFNVGTILGGKVCFFAV